MSAAEHQKPFENRRLLVVSTNYAPELTGIGPYATQLAEHWAASGARTEVLTGMPHYPAWRVDERYRGCGGGRRAAKGCACTGGAIMCRPVRLPCEEARSRRPCSSTGSSPRRRDVPTR